MGIAVAEGNRGLGWAIDAVPALKAGSGVGIPSPPAIRRSNGFIGLPDIRDAERLQGFRANWTVAAESSGGSRRIRWRLVGNAVSVPVAQWIGERLRSEPGEIKCDVHLLSRDAPWPRAAFYDGRRRSAVDVTTWPVQRRSAGLEGFLRYPLTPLSQRATRGFTDRLVMSSLRYPAWFREELEQHWLRLAA
jgi:DNA (cytosine-5)-methyltransferase 1